MSPGSRGRPSKVGPGLDEPLDVVGGVGDDVVAPQRHRWLGARPLAELGAPHHPQPERLPGADQSRLGEVRLDRVHDDAFLAELGAVQHGVEGVEQRTVRAPVDAEGLGGRRRLRGLEVGDDVTAAEGVDRLLGVTDQHHRGGLGEGPLEDLPLHRVGVLELVDQHELPPVLHPPPRGRRGVLQRVGELAEQVVVAEHAEASLAPLHLLEHLGREADARRRRRVGRLGQHRRRLDHRTRVADDGARELERSSAGPRRRLLGAEAGEVEVVDGLGGQLLEVLDERRGGVGVAGHAEAAEHELAELVDGGDGGGVERHERRGQPVEPRRELGVVGGEQPVVQPVVGVAARRVAEQLDGLVELAAYALAQLLARRPRERDDEHLVEADVARRDVLGDQGGDGPGLAGAGARLEQRGAGPQVGGDVEGLQGRHLRSPGSARGRRR